MAKKILIVDDDRYLVEIYRNALSKEGYEVSCAYDGEEGIEVFKKIPQPDLIILDLKMPNMTGDDFIKFLRRNNLIKNTKVLILSSVLYQYKSMFDREDLADLFGGHTYMKQDGLTTIGKKAEKGQPTQMQEKTEQKVKPAGFGTEIQIQPESQGEFEQHVSEDLLKRVKELFGEPYIEKKRKRGLMPHIPPTLIRKRVIELIAEYLKIDKERLFPSTHFEKDLNVSYVAELPLRRRINKEFGIKISFEEHQKIETIQDLIDVVEYTKQFDTYDKKRLNKEFWEEYKPVVSLAVIFALIVLGMFVWELIVKKYFLK